MSEIVSTTNRVPRKFQKTMDKIKKDNQEYKQFFHAYDIRGKYPNLDEDFAYSLAKVFHGKVLVARDVRLSSKKLALAFISGLKDNLSVDDFDYLGIVSTPWFYFALSRHNYDYGVMITASHNPKEYCGFKLCIAKAVPLQPKEIMSKFVYERIPDRSFFRDIKSGVVDESQFIDLMLRKSTFQQYVEFFEPYYSQISGDIKIVVDFANGSATFFEKEFLSHKFFDAIFINDFPDGSFPSHIPDTLKEEARKQIVEKVRSSKASIGLIFDGDADRIGIIDDLGRNIPGDILTIIIGKEIEKDILFKEHREINLGYDIRSTMVIKEEFSNTWPLKVGHLHIKKAMRDYNLDFAGELSNHFYFKSIGYFEAPLLALYYIIKAMNKNKLSELYDLYARYYKSEEINFKVNNKDCVLEKIRKKYGCSTCIDGITRYFSDWWFNVRPSNTESFIRLNLEAKTRELYEEKLNEVMKSIKSFIDECDN